MEEFEEGEAEVSEAREPCRRNEQSVATVPVTATCLVRKEQFGCFGRAGRPGVTASRLGACAAGGQTACVDGGVTDSCAPGEPAAELPLHTSFRLRSDGEYLALVAPDGVTVLSEFSPGYPRQFEDVSYGRASLGREGD